ncbi:MAG: hypothetical protein L6Q97_12250 [Thermoanaerobaculia bacterium]|nr:hypothetical protein [Thermoanaerobaculia bacterium]
MKIKSLYLLLFLGLTAAAGAQKFPEHLSEEPRNTGPAILFHVGAGTHLPGGDLADRFGQDASVGGGLELITGNHFLLGAEGHFLFGQKVKEDPLAIIRTPQGDIIGTNQYIASVVLRERGYYLGGMIGKLFPIGKKRSGLRITAGAGVLRHKIRLQDDSQSVNAIAGDYAKGYDRLSGGFALNQFIGWQHLAANRRANWFIGLEFNQGFTKSLRDWDFAEMRKLEGSRTDLRFGIRAAWTLPFYVGNAEKIYY